MWRSLATERRPATAALAAAGDKPPEEALRKADGSRLQALRLGDFFRCPTSLGYEFKGKCVSSREFKGK